MRTNSSMPAAAAIAILAMLVMISPARADGKYFRQSNVLAEPEIPSQRAIITFRDGVQTLIVESTVKGQGESLGWVLPLPAEPIAIEPCSAGTIRSMEALVQPEIKGDQFGKEWIQGSLTVLLIVIAACLIVTFAKKRGASVLAVLLMVLLLVMFVGLLLPTLGMAGGRGGSSVAILSSQQVGSYEVTIIRGNSGDAVRAWLTDNGFVFDQADSIELDRYVKDQWCFAVARIRNEGNGEQSPHPLKVAFPTTGPIYPMRLTGLTRAPLQLDLYIIASQRAATSNLSTWHCDTFVKKTQKNLHEVEQPAFGGREHGLVVGHPELVSLMWEGCVLTHLNGTLSSGQMKSDLAVDCNRPFKSTRHKIYSQPAALGMSAGIVMLMATVLAIILTIAKEGRSLSATIAGKHAGLGALALAAIGTVIYLACDVHAITTAGQRRYLWDRYAYRLLTHLKEHAPIEDLSAFLTSEDLMPPGLQFEKGDTPFGYELATINDGWHVTLYDRHAIPTRMMVKRQGEMTPLP